MEHKSLAHIVRQKRAARELQIRKKERILPMCPDERNIYIENQKKRKKYLVIFPL
jgi:hypothetical protein